MIAGSFPFVKRNMSNCIFRVYLFYLVNDK